MIIKILIHDTLTNLMKAIDPSWRGVWQNKLKQISPSIVPATTSFAPLSFLATRKIRNLMLGGKKRCGHGWGSEVA